MNTGLVTRGERSLVRTERGKLMTLRQYVALQRAVSARTGGGGPACEYGHFGDAAWEGGPCLDEVLGLLGEDT